MSVHIREAGKADLDTIVDFNCRLAAETEGKTLDRHRVRDGVAALLADAGKGRYWLAELDGEPAGQLMITREWSDWRNGTFWWIQSVYVRDAARGTGVFSALYRHVETLARNDPGICGIRLYVERGNERAQRTYAALGLVGGAYRVMETVFDQAH